ncbi:ABC transporter permease [Brachybacterium sp. DNPG3]
MFVAWRDLRHAKGRFALIGAVVALITLLVGFLAGLTGGLAEQNVSAVLDLPGDRLVLAEDADGTASFAQSSLDEATVTAWTDADGVESATPIGILQGRADDTAVAILGVPAGSSAGTSAGDAAGTSTSPIVALAPSADDAIGLSAGAADDLGVAVGDSVQIAGSDYRVESIGADAWYSHTPVVVLTSDAWASASERLGGTGEPTVLAVTGSPDWDALAAETGTQAASPLASLGALETFRSEIGSLGLMIALLFGVSALVVGAFFTVWTMQRSADVAVLKALGASTAALVRDALGQALVVLVVGIGTGLLAVLGLGLLASGVLPFVLSPLTTLLPGAVMTVLGLAGAAVALRTVTHADPLTALGSAR